MEVRATKAGFYETLRQPGDVFHVPDGIQASWFVSAATFVAVPPEIPLGQLAAGNNSTGEMELGHVEITGSSEDGKAVFKPYPENATPAEATPETPTKPGKGKRE